MRLYHCAVIYEFSQNHPATVGAGSARNIEYIYRQNSWYKSFSIVPYWSPLSLEVEMREIFGKMSPISREIFLEMGELILICTAVGDAMVCPVVMLAPR
jgi:hypothetical protein